MARDLLLLAVQRRFALKLERETKKKKQNGMAREFKGRRVSGQGGVKNDMEK